MADFVFNIAKGRVNELARRVNGDDPANSALIIVALATAGLESDAVLMDKVSLADLVSGTTNEATNAGYARKTVTSVTSTSDDINNYHYSDIADQTFAAIVAGDGWSKIVVCYDPDTTAGTDSTLVPLVSLDVSAIPDGSDILLTINSGGIFRAT